MPSRDRRPPHGQPYALRGSISSLEPHADLAGLVSGFDVHHSGAAADGAVLRILLMCASARINVELLGLATEGARDAIGSAPSALPLFRPRHELQPRVGFLWSR
jgi:hypothetical protein